MRFDARRRAVRVLDLANRACTRLGSLRVARQVSLCCPSACVSSRSVCLASLSRSLSRLTCRVRRCWRFTTCFFFFFFAANEQSNVDVDNLSGAYQNVDFGGLGSIDVVYTWVNGSDPRQIAGVTSSERVLSVCAFFISVSALFAALREYQESVRVANLNLNGTTKHARVAKSFVMYKCFLFVDVVCRMRAQNA